MEENKKANWETVYATKSRDQMSWTQEVPITSLELVRSLDLSKTANIIDIGGGDSKLADYLLEEGFENIAVLDISAKAIERSKKGWAKGLEKLSGWFLTL